MIKVFLDDQRPPYDDSWVVVRTPEEFYAVVNGPNPIDSISFDHDIGDHETGMDLARWFIDQVMDHPDKFNSIELLKIHSANPVGNRNITTFLKNAQKHGILSENVKIVSWMLDP